MSSDYIPRLRSELLRAGAANQARSRRVRMARELRPLAAAAVVVALLALAVGLTLSQGGNDETSVERSSDPVRLSYRVEPAGAAAAEQTAQVMRARLAAAGIDGADVSVPSGASLTITAPAGARADVAALVARGRLAIYDWERSVLGGPAAVTKAEAEARASARPDGRVVRDMVSASRGWSALDGDPAITNADIASARSSVDESTQEPIVTIEFTARGQTAFSTLTRNLAHRGSAEAADQHPANAEAAYQHLAIVLDDRILTMPYINFREVPDGIDGSAGTRISGGLTPETASRIAAILSAGPLPAALANPVPGG
jgi:preprotein translocase subunit SecD